jgi:pimeloyl-ACP methyl ester carboxylesterase
MKKFLKTFLIVILLIVSETFADSDSKFVDVLNIKIHYKDFGTGNITFLLIHGFGAGTFSFDPIMDDLSKYGRVVALDLPGFGLSERPSNNIGGINPYIRSGQVEVLRAFIEKLDLNNIILVGHSMGGSIAFIYASKYPERIKAVILEAPAVFNEGSDTLLLKFLRTKVGKFLFPLLVKPLTYSLEKLIYKAYYDKTIITEELKKKYKRALLVKDWEKGLYYLITASNYVNYDELIQNYHIKTLIIVGSKDEIVPKEKVLSFASKLKEVEIIEIDNCGHIPHEEKLKEFLDSIIYFCQYKL